MPYDITYMWNLKYGTKEPTYETEIDSQTQRTDLWLPRGSGVEEGWIGSLGLADANYYLWSKQQGLTVQHRKWELYSVSCNKP